MTRPQTLAAIVRESHSLFVRYLKGFDAANCTATTPHLPNHVLWTLGHLSLTMYRCAGKIAPVELPTSVFIDGPVGDSLRFGIESVAFGSRPKPDASIYPAYERAREIFDDAVERICHTFEHADDDALDIQVAWGSNLVPGWSMAARVAFHNGTHCGQIVDLRRALGLPSIFG